MKKLLEKLVNLIPYKWVMSFFDTIESISGQKVKVVVSIFGRKTPVELDMMQIDKK